MAADGVFRVRALSHPARQPRPQEPPEPLDGVGRPAPPPGPGALPGYDVVLEPEAAAAPDDRLVVLSDVRLDDAKAYDTLLAVLRRYNREAPAPGLFVLCGDFFAPRPPLQGPATWFEECARTLAAKGAGEGGGWGARGKGRGTGEAPAGPGPRAADRGARRAARGARRLGCAPPWLRPWIRKKVKPRAVCGCVLAQETPVLGRLWRAATNSSAAGTWGSGSRLSSWRR